MLSETWNDFLRPCGAWMNLLAVIPAINRWAIVGRPYGTSRVDSRSPGANPDADA